MSLITALLTPFGASGAETSAETLGWRVGMQAWTFNSKTLFEAIDNSAKLGLKNIEAFEGQQLSKELGADVKFSRGMSEEHQKVLQDKLAASGVTLALMGVSSAADEADWRKLFQFAKDMGVETITSEPTTEQLDLVATLCDEYSINIAIHNHPKGPHSPYWNPETVLNAINGRTNRMGACADTGHWARSGLDAVECLKKLEGRIISLHLKDVNVKTADGHDVPWGTGICDVPAILAELKRQGFKGCISIEYEYNWDNSMPDIEACLKFFEEQTTVLVK